MTDKELEQFVRVSVKVLMDAVVETIGIDGHAWSDRPCQTCKAVSGLIGQSYGCYWYQAKRMAERNEE